AEFPFVPRSLLSIAQRCNQYILQPKEGSTGECAMSRMPLLLLGCLGLAATMPLPAGEGAPGGAAWPKGQYAALDRLPDWGGVWVLNRAVAAPGAARPQPQLKGPYLAQYQAWQKQLEED